MREKGGYARKEVNAGAKDMDAGQKNAMPMQGMGCQAKERDAYANGIKQRKDNAQAKGRGDRERPPKAFSFVGT